MTMHESMMMMMMMCYDCSLQLFSVIAGSFWSWLDWMRSCHWTVLLCHTAMILIFVLQRVTPLVRVA